MVITNISIDELEKKVREKIKSDNYKLDTDVDVQRARIEDKTGRGRFDLLPPRAITRLAQRFEFGSKKYDDRNWENGILFSSLSSSALRHMFKYLKGDTDEDHLIAAVWNLMAIAEQEELIKEGKLSKELNDIELKIKLKDKKE